MKARNESVNKSKSSAATVQASQTPPDMAAYPREQLVAVAAYYRAEHRGFAPNADLSDWLEAEVEVESLLNNIH